MTFTFLAALVLAAELYFLMVGYRFFGSSEEAGLENIVGNVSILKPLKGMGVGLRENIISFLRLKSAAKVQIIFAVEDENDEVIPFLERILRSEATEHEIMVLKGLPRRGRNPKNSNLHHAFEEAKYEWIYISDADCRVEPDHLQSVLRLTNSYPDVFVTTLPVSRNLQSFAARLQAVGTNLDGVQYFAFSERTGKPLIFGGSSLFHRKLATDTRVFDRCLNLISEDLAMARIFDDQGATGRVLLTPVELGVGGPSLPAFERTWIRWLSITRTLAPDVFWLAPLNWWWQAFFVFSVVTASLSALRLAIFFLILRALRFGFYQRKLGIPMREGLPQLLLLPLYDLMVPFYWARSIFSRTVEFGGNVLRFNRHGELK